MGRSATNVVGNSLATAAVSKWEGEIARRRGRLRRSPRRTGLKESVMRLGAAHPRRRAGGPRPPERLGRRTDRHPEEVRDSRAIILGVRESSLPFSFLNPGGRPVGYSIDLCQEIVAEVTSELGGIGPIEIRYKTVTSENRFAMLRSGESTSNAARPPTTGCARRRSRSRR